MSRSRKSSPENLRVPKPRRFVLLGFLIIGLIANSAVARAGGISTGIASNSPAIYVAKPEPETTNGLGSWIWDRVTFNKQTVRLWHGFNLPKTNPVVRAELRIAADNAFKVWLDGQELGSGSDWRTLSIYHLEGTLRPGAHVLAVEGFNDNDQAGVILGLRLVLANGQELQIQSDQTWRVVPNSENDWQTVSSPAADWPNASAAANFGRVPWWNIPTSVLHIRQEMPKPISVWQSRAFQIGLLVGCAVFVLICIYLLIQLVSQSKAHHLVQAERDRIARDIHDDLGSKLTQLLLTGEVAQIESAHAHGTPLARMCDSAREILATIDEVVWTVNSRHDNLEDFVIYVCKYAQHFLQSSSIRCRFDIPQDLPVKTLSELTRRNLFLATKEALNNAVKHSQATELTVRIELNGSELHVIVADNGRGFDCAQIGQERNGLTNMKVRMAEIEGDCEVVDNSRIEPLNQGSLVDSARAARASRLCESKHTGGTPVPLDSWKGCQVIFRVPLKERAFFKSLFRLRSQNRSGARSHRKDVSSSNGKLIKDIPEVA